MVGSATSGQMVLGCIRKQVEQNLKSKPACSSLVSASVSASQFQPLVAALTSLWFGTCKPSKPFPLLVALGHGIHHSNRKQTRIGTNLQVINNSIAVLSSITELSWHHHVLRGFKNTCSQSHTKALLFVVVTTHHLEIMCSGVFWTKQPQY